MSKVTATHRISQARSEFLSNTKGFFAKCTPSYRKTTATIIKLDNKYETVSLAQGTLAGWSGIRRETANRHIKFSDRIGMIKTQQPNGLGDKLIYNVNPILHDKEIRRELAATFPEFKECFSEPTIKWALAPKKMFIKINILAKENYVTRINKLNINKINFVRVAHNAHNAYTRGQESVIQAEEIKARLSPEQKAQLEFYRKQRSISRSYDHPLADSSVSRSERTKSAIANWVPETLEDVFASYGIAVT